MSEDRVRVLRIVEYEGPRSWVEATVARSIHGTKDCSASYEQSESPLIIRAVTLGSFPEIIKRAVQKAVTP